MPGCKWIKGLLDREQAFVLPRTNTIVFVSGKCCVSTAEDLFLLVLYLTYGRLGLNVLGYQSHLHCNVAILPVVTKDLPISPRFSPSEFFSRCKDSIYSYNSTNG